MHAFSLIQEKSSEFQIPIWIACIDFQKAFDSVEHSAIWEALATQGVNLGCIEILKRLYIEQSGQVRANKRLSRTFQIKRGTKQGDLLSSLLFNAVLESCFADVRHR